MFVGILMDLQGPKIRISSFVNDKIELNKGDQFTLDASRVN
jgi:pyruvate kinase